MLLETTFGWDLDNNAVNLIDEDDEVHMNPHQLIALLCNVSVRKLIVLLLMTAVCAGGCGNECPID
jgi:hypothetical protein